MSLKNHHKSKEKTLENLEDIVHDMKIPLTIMYTQMQSLEDSEDLSKGSFDTILSLKRNWFRVMKLLNDLSDFERLQNGEINLSLKNFDIVKVFNDLVDASSSLARKKGISLILKSNVEKKVMAIDKDIFDRIILNLLSNGIKYSNSNDNIYINLIYDNDFISITVKNKTKINKPLTTKSLMKRYIKLDNNSTEITESKTSKGIGLDIVKEFVMLLDGDINFQINDGVSIIEIILPTFTVSKEHNVKQIDDFYSYNILDIELSDDYDIKF